MELTKDLLDYTEDSKGIYIWGVSYYGCYSSNKLEELRNARVITYPQFVERKKVYKIKANRHVGDYASLSECRNLQTIKIPKGIEFSSDTFAKIEEY